MIQFGTKLESLLSTDRICNLIKYSNLCQGLGGYISEFGVYAGGSLEILAFHNPNNEILAFDSFEGLPAPSEHDFHRKGEFGKISYDDIAGYFAMIYPRVRIIKGFSPRVFDICDPNVRFSFVHVDVDLYQSVKDAIDFFLPRMLTNGILLFDDYKVSSTPGCELAIKELNDDRYFDRFISHREELKYFSTDESKSHNQYLIMKS